jgi:hypothetical protein
VDGEDPVELQNGRTTATGAVAYAVRADLVQRKRHVTSGDEDRGDVKRRLSARPISSPSKVVDKVRWHAEEAFVDLDLDVLPQEALVYFISKLGGKTPCKRCACSAGGKLMLNGGEDLADPGLGAPCC